MRQTGAWESSSQFEPTVGLRETRKQKPVSRSKQRIARRSFKIPSPVEVAARATAGGGWESKQLAEWGITWPPIIGWRAYLKAIWLQEGSVLHDTVFDIAFRDQWQGLPSDARVPLLRVRPLP
jgi:hypothetical protein